MNFDFIKTATQLQTLALTVPMLVLCVMVLLEIRKPAHEVCFQNRSCKKSKQMCWIFFGLFFGFTGKIIESLWWSVPWVLAYIDHPRWFEFNSYGVFFNLIFRQLFFTVSAYCHLRAFIPTEAGLNTIKYINLTVLCSFILGQISILYLFYIKQGVY